MANFTKNEEQIFLTLCNKYGIVPTIPIEPETKKDRPTEVTERVTDLRLAIIEIGHTHPLVKEYEFMAGNPDHISEKTLAQKELEIMILALNEGKPVDITKENGYAPYFNYNKKPTSGFFYDGYCSWSSGYGHSESLPAHLLLRSSKLALHAGKTFEHTYYRAFK